MITAQHVFWLVGALFAAWSLLSLTDRSNPKRLGNAAFWGLVALSLLAGHRLGDVANGVLVLGLAGLATFRLIGRGAPSTGETERAAAGARHGNLLFLPILVVLLTAVIGTLVYLYTPLFGTGLLEAGRETFV